MYRKSGTIRPHTRPAGAGDRGRWFIPALILALALLAFGATTALAVNPPPQQLYYVSLPEDDLLQLFDDDDVAGGTFPDPVSPIRSITSISIGSSGTLVYWDQWEDGGYDADLANPGANVYANPGNLDGTQIWGDGVLANGCPPSISNVPNPCTLAADDLLQAGDVIVLDNDVIVSGTTPGPYTRNAAQVFFDGRDKFGATFPVAVTRAAFPVSPGSVMAGANEVLDTGRWGVSYVSPLGEDTPAASTRTFEDVRWFIMAGVGGATISVDANGDGDYLDSAVGDLSGANLAAGERRVITSVLMGASLTSNSPVQVNSMTADVNDTFEFRWDALLPRPVWNNDYYTPVGTAPKTSNSGCTEAWVYNPASTNNVRDEFSVQAYNNNNGSQNWVNNWTETGDDTSATAGDILVNGSGQLEFNAGIAGGDTIFRSVNLSGVSSATLRFRLDNTRNLDATDDIAVDVSTNGTTWTNVEQIDYSTLTDGTNPWVFPLYRSYDLATYVGQANLRIRFRAVDALEAGNAWYFDDVDVRYGTALTVSYDFPGGASPDGTFVVPAGSSARSPLIGYNNGARLYSTAAFLPISIADCTRDTSGTEGRLYDWGNPLFPVDNLTSQVVVPFAAGCSSESFLGVCRDADSTSPYTARDVTTDGSRSPVWVTPLANTTIYVDYDGSGISCPSGAGSETSIAASTLVSYRIVNDPTTRAYVRHGFTSGNYTGTDNIGQGWPQTSSAWANNWTETGDDNSATGGAIQVVTNELRFGNTGTADETGRNIRRGVNLTGQNYANLRFHLRDTGLAATDKLAVEATRDGTNWTRLATFQGDQVAATYDPVATTYAVNISPYISANTAIRFVILNNMTGTVYWFVDDVHIDYAQGGDWDMTGARLATCNGVKIAAAYGQDPALSGGNDEEALDFGTGIAPFGSDIAIEKSADKTVVAQGGLVNYTFDVTNLGTTNLFDVSVTDNKCSPTVYVSGDNNPADGFLNPFPAETWIYTCSSNIYFDTTNVAYSTGTPESETTPINSAPDEWTVTVIPPAVVGNYVWLDEDGDGDQDAGEAGIPNVLVTLTGTDTFGNPVSLTTYTDANGGYLFDGLPPSNGAGYTITVTPPAGLNQTYDENGPLDNSSTVVLAAGDEHLSADFGYNWASPVDTNNPPTGALGAIGDRVWIDANGDGIQDPGEAGIPNVTVTLYTDPDGDGVYDTVAGTTMTDAAGNYIFDNLPAGAYVVDVTAPTGYAQTGDPDDALDNRTTSPVVLGPGDVYVNADFGYQPTGTSSDIGDTVWFDANANGVQNAGENGIPGVTVALILDDGDGIYEPGIDQIIATDITDENGLYLFPGLPSGTYFTMVTDTENVLGELAPTYDADGGDDEISKVIVDGVNDNLLQDFGYAPPGQELGEGLIGDTVWLDRDGDGQYDPGEGLEGVRVTLTEPGADGILGTADDTTRDTFTDENGNYSFGKLQPDSSYGVLVDTATLPPGVTNTVDPDGGFDSTSVVTLTPAAPINLNQDFAYRDLTNPNTVGGTLWEDRNADGTLDGGEAARFAGVTVVLKNANGNIIATTTTDSNGDYLFSGLPDGTYTIDVTDDGNTLNGYWKSDGPNPGADNNSQVDPYTVSVAGGQTNLTGDFGYYIDPAALGNWVWDDLNNNGIQDAGEPGIAGVRIALQITYPNGDITTIYTVTDANGYYEFGNLLLDEDYNGIGAGEPTFSIAVVSPPAGYAPGLILQGSNAAVDSNNHNGAPATTTQGSINDTYDFNYVRTASIGNAVWLDENGDGIQDAGESGIPNVIVELWDATHTTVVATTVTDANGGYLFTNVPAGTYQVDVLNGSLPTGLVQSTPTFPGGDFTNKVDPFTVTVAPGGEDLTADFGYNWAPTSDVTGNTGTGAIGDRIWVDVDGDGFQDPEEIGIQGVTVELVNLGPDGIYGTGDDIVTTTTTNATGNYIFDNLNAGAYVVRIPTPPAGYTQTGDPDQFGIPCTSCDNLTTTPILLAPGDVFVNADFGYQPPANTTGSIGDRVWFDANADGVQDAGEYGIPGVTVALVKDSNGNGRWDPGEPIIGSDTTDANGNYLFSGLPATDGAGTDDYLVWVNDTDNVLANHEWTYDRDGSSQPNPGVVTGKGITAVSNITPTPITDVDFGYTAFGAKPNRGLIGDTIFLDRNNSGAPDAGEAVEGVVVELRDASNNLIATTVTDENGNYYFADLPVTGPGVTYNVVVAASNFAPGGPLEGTTNSVDPDGGNNSTSQIVLTTGNPVNLAQDFGYVATQPGSIGNLVWNDLNANGVVDAGENGIPGVTVDLYRDLDGNGRIDPGEPKIGTATTDANGAYLFNGLPTTGGDYVVDVSDTAGVLTGWWHSLGTAGLDNNSQPDPYAVTLTPGAPNNLTADFGYYVKPGAIGNWIWMETVGSNYGLQETGEVGIPNVEVTLTIAWPGDGTTVVKTLTDANGYYSFDNLLLDENFDGTGAGEPTYTISVDTSQPALAGLTPSPIEAGDGVNPFPPDLNSNDPAGTLAVAIQGQTDTSAGNNTAIINWTDFGFYPEGTTPVSLAFFSATRNGDRVNFAWTTATEAGNAGFNLYVQTAAGREKVNSKLIRSRGVSSLQPQDYTYQAAVRGGDTFFIEEVSILQAKQAYGPFETGQPAGERLTVEEINWAAVNAEHEMKQAERAVQDAAKVNEALQADKSQSRLESPLTSYTRRASGLASMGLAKKPTPIALPTELIPSTRPKKPTPTPIATATPAPPTATPTSAPTVVAPTATPEPPPAAALRVAELQVNRTGLYRVSYESLLAAGLDLTGQPASNLALTLRNTPVPIRVSSPATFGPGAYIEFYGEGLDTLYTDTNVYVLWVDRSLAQRIGEEPKAPGGGAALPTYYMATAEVNQQRKYDFSARGTDPWYDLAMWVDRGQSVTWDRSITLDNYVAGVAPSTLKAGFWGALDYDANPDHHIVVKLNGQNIADRWFNGMDALQVAEQLPVDLARDGANTLTLVMPGDLPAGVDLDGMRLDNYSITYPRGFVARNGRLTFTASNRIFQVTGLPNNDVVVYRLENGTPVFLSGAQAAGDAVTFAGSNGEATYVVSAAEAAFRPNIVPATGAIDILTGPARYLIISHPDFIAGLTPLIQAREAQGFTVKVANVEDVYRQFSGGVFDPVAIREYIKHAETNMGTEYVLLVGADTYDYRNYLTLNGISFIPSLYVATDDIVRYAPVDPLYADTDGSGAPNLAIGRFPVRTSAELSALINKTLAYANKTYGRTAIFAADRYFGSDSNAFIGQMPADWSVRKAHLDEIGVAASRTALLQAMNEGVALTSFVGHSGLTVWTQEGLFSATDAAALTNVGKPTVVTQWGCWNTYYVDPAYKTLGQKLMASGENGSMAVLGPTTLTLAASERRLGQLLTPRLTQPGVTIGVAIQAAKAEMALTQPNAIDVLLGWSLLGDPAVIVQP